MLLYSMKTAVARPSKYNGFWEKLVSRAKYFHRDHDMCHHCGLSVKNEPFYMVKNGVWRRGAKMGPKYVQNDPVGGPFLHLRCLEIRLKRALRPKDFDLKIETNKWLVRSAVIVMGNPKYILGPHRQWAIKFYARLQKYLESLGYEVSRDPGKPFTSPPKADLWIGHSRGADRLGGSGTKSFGIGVPGRNLFPVVNHPKDPANNWTTDSSLPLENPQWKYHYILTPEMKKRIKEL